MLRNVIGYDMTSSSKVDVLTTCASHTFLELAKKKKKKKKGENALILFSFSSDDVYKG